MSLTPTTAFENSESMNGIHGGSIGSSNKMKQ